MARAVSMPLTKLLHAFVTSSACARGTEFGLDDVRGRPLCRPHGERGGVLVLSRHSA
jgi:hypothetical protein